jgi:uncharacterized protein
MEKEIASELDRLLRGMQPVLHECPVAFCTVHPGDLSYLSREPLCIFREDEGATIILPVDDALREGLEFSGQWAHITLRVHSSLNAVGFMAVVASGLARAGISVNPVSAFHHDHLFIPWERRDEAMLILEKMSADITAPVIANTCQ